MTMQNTNSTVTDTADMLALIGKVTADISDRMEAQEKALEDIRALGRAGNALMAERFPLSSEKIETLKRSLTQVRQEIARHEAEYARMEIAEREARDRLAERERNYQALLGSCASLRDDALMWKRWTWVLLPMAVLVTLGLSVVVPSFLARSPVTCGLMKATWQDQNNGYAACYFLSQSD